MVKSVTPKKACELISESGYRYLDVRSEPEFASGHPEGAVNIPLLKHDPRLGMVPNERFLDVVKRVFDQNERIVVGCKSGGRSHRAASILLDAGYSDVLNMDGGFSGRYNPIGLLEQPGWKDEGLPVAEHVDPDATYEALRRTADLD